MDNHTIYDVFREFPFVVTDTRQITLDCLFFALKGDRFDGNQFAEEALHKGARYVIVDDPSVVKDERYLLVDDTLLALQQVARLHRETLSIPVIGLTGTNGKTTTKELIASVLSRKYRVQATRGNLNNHIGVPLTLLEIRGDTEIAIIEMGANHVGEIAVLCELAQPTDGFITNIGKAHLEGFGNFEGVKKAKGELYDYLSAHGGVVFLQGDNSVLRDMAAERFGTGATTDNRLYSYGTSEANRVQGEVISADPFLRLRWETDGKRHEVRTNLAGAYNLENILAAIAVGSYFGVAPLQINKGLAAYHPSNNRSQVIDTSNGNRVIGDYYNANASSMKVALESIAELQDSRPKVLILGDMFEMGVSSAKEHRNVIRQALDMDAAIIVFVGKSFYAERRVADINDSPNPVRQVHFYATLDETKAALLRTPIRNTLILLKGSRGIAMEGLIGLL